MPAIEELMDITHPYPCLWLATDDGIPVALDQDGHRTYTVFSGADAMTYFCMAYGKIFQPLRLEKPQFYAWLLVKAAKHYDIIEFHQADGEVYAVPLTDTASVYLRNRHMV